MDCQSYKACLEEVAKIAPAFTAIIAVAAVGVAWWSLAAQKRVARRRAAIDFFLKTEMDKEMLDAHQRYLDAVKVLKAEPDVRKFVDRGGRVGLNSVSVPIDGFPANYLPRLPWWGVA